MGQVSISKIGKLWVVQNNLIQVSLDSERCWFDVLEKKSGITWSHDPWDNTVGELVLERKVKEEERVMVVEPSIEEEKKVTQKITVDLSSAEEKTISEIENGTMVHLSKFKVEGESIEGSITFQLLISDGSEPKVTVKITDFQPDRRYSPKQLHLPCRAFPMMTALDRGYVVLPNVQGGVLPVGQKVQTPEQVIPSPAHFVHEVPFTASGIRCNAAGISMPWFGAVKGESSYMAIIETPDDCAIHFIGHDKRREQDVRIASISPIWDFSLGGLAYTRVISYAFQPGGGYVEMTKAFRKYTIERGEFKSFREKIKNNPNVKKLLGAPLVEFLILTNVAEDREFHPRLIGYKKLWYTFSDISRILRDMHDNLGIEKAMIILLGWNREGCDHGYPDTWPPNQEAGGLEGLRELIETANKLGYLIGIHDCYTFTSKGAPSLKEKGEEILLENPVYSKSYPWDGGPSYVVCPQARLRFAKRNISIYKREIPSLTAHFTDCLSGWPLYECYNPKHLTTRTNDKELKIQLLKFISEDAKLIIGSEVGVSYLVPYTHYFMSINQNGPRQCIWTPLWNLVYHGAINCYWHEGESYNRPGFQSSYPYVEKFLRDLLCGQPSQWNFYCDGYEYYRERLKETYHFLSRLSEAIALDEMIDHQFLTEDFFVQMSKFSGGTEIYVNFRDRDYKKGELEIPARGFYVKSSPLGTFEGHFEGEQLKLKR